jgi:branched-chain amino acid transport system substrate-binding protein
MKISLRSTALAAVAAALLTAAPASAETIKIGLIAPFSGPTSLFGISWKQAVDVYLKTHGDTIGGDKIEVIDRDLPGPDPLKARALAQELVVKEGCQYLAGLAYSPNALALGAFANQAKVPIVIFNAATSSILDKSPYFLRVSYTLPQVSAPEALYAYQQGFRKMVTMVEDYAPGWDAERLFTETYTKAGGQILGKIGAAEEAVILLDAPDGSVGGEAAAALALGLRLRAYRFDRYKTKKKDDEDDKVPQRLTIAVEAVAEARRLLRGG